MRPEGCGPGRSSPTTTALADGAASIRATLPALLLMFAGQRFIIAGCTLGSVT
jgi:ABC-type glycerol-3-phosphate transport system permease component